MAYVSLDTKKLKENYNHLDKLFKKNNIQWAVVTKVLSGNRKFLTELLNIGVNQVCDSRVTNLRTIKKINQNVETVYIKPVPKKNVKSIVEIADISFNTELSTIKLLSEEAKRQNKTHKIIIMIEMGELREGVMRHEFIDFYESVFNLPNIEVVGIGTNFTCLYGVLPNHDKLIQLGLYEELIEAKFNKTIPYVSGGSSVVIPLIDQKLLPSSTNHFRVGETLFLGTDVYNDKPYKNMHNDVFKLYAQIIELTEKPVVPIGEMGTNVEGEEQSFNNTDYSERTLRAIIDIGLLDVERQHIWPVDKNIKYSGGSSDMIVVDLGENKKNYKVGDFLEFTMDYMGVLRIINSKYIEKVVV